MNYVVSSNEDIFQLLQYDILLHLIAQYDIKLEEQSFSESTFLHQFVTAEINPVILIPTLIGIIPKVGSSLKEIYNKLKPQYDQFIKKFPSESETLSKLRNTIEGRNTIYEDSDVTDLIRAIVSGIEEKNEVKLILILDDLDRIDPQHIFRLFNVFSAHLNPSEGESNKYGFNKVVFVCDEVNIRNIYSHKYGQDVDYKGYFDKFYSYDVFNFNNEINNTEYLSGIVTLISNSYSNTNPEIDKFIKENLNSKFFNAIVKALVDSNLLNLRSLLKTTQKDLGFDSKLINMIDDHTSILNWQVPGIMHLCVLRQIIGDTHSLRSVFKELQKNGSIRLETRTLLRLMEQQLTISTYKYHKFSNNQDEWTYNLTGTKLRIKFTLQTNHFPIELHHVRLVQTARGDSVHFGSVNVSESDLYEIILDNIEILGNKGVL